MKKLQRYVLKNVAAAFLAAFAALVLLMVVGLCMQLLHEGLDVVRLRSLLVPMLAYCVPVVLPSAFLTAVILAFGRMSADNELTAVRAAGIPLYRMAYPVLVAGLALSLVAAYFQFEAVPRARGAIKTLKYQVLRQMLLDQVALSWKRQFSFGPVHIQYDGFSDGQMKGVVVLEVPQNRPRTIVTAASATVRPDLQHGEFLVFEMRDCLITRFDLQDSSEARTLKSEKAIYSIRVSPDQEAILSHRKHLPLRRLLARRKSLGEAVAGQPRLENPEAVFEDELAKRRRLDGLIGELDRTIASVGGKHVRYAELEPKRRRQLIERNEQLVAEAQQRIAELQAQLTECVRQLDEMQGDGADLERLVELRQRQKGLIGDIEGRKADVARSEAEMADAERAIADANARAAQIQSQMDELNERRTVLAEQRDGLSRAIRAADDQYELGSIRVRIHKRLAQAASVLVFALVGMPLGIMASRRSVMTAFGAAFAIVLLVFYPLLILGQIAAEAGSAPVVPALWAGNALTFAIGAVLTGCVLRR